MVNVQEWFTIDKWQGGLWSTINGWWLMWDPWSKFDGGAMTSNFNGGVDDWQWMEGLAIIDGGLQLQFMVDGLYIFVSVQ